MERSSSGSRKEGLSPPGTFLGSPRDARREQLGAAQSLNWCLRCPFPGWSRGSRALPAQQRRAQRLPAQNPQEHASPQNEDDTEEQEPPAADTGAPALVGAGGQGAPAGDVPTALPGRREGQGCGDPCPTGLLGCAGRTNALFCLPFSLGCANSRWRLGRSVEMWMQLEMAMDIDVPEDEEMEVDGEEEEAMDVDPPSGGQARAPHALPAGREGLLPSGWGWGWGGWSPLQGHGARSPRPGGKTAPTALP
ncbi:uncharacterized protein LOC128911093 [Rissa tridactyla]|uniref:uncharacterized protein LOC128911093 n=1 Tax=Rissa tridactyla TaxID=75485 RepID=UPI0023BAD1EF|nr:uncharacterized protein LOC128911093 [Rissa tridactyla]